MPATPEILRARRKPRQPKPVPPEPEAAVWVRLPVWSADHADTWTGAVSLCDETYDVRRSVVRDDETATLFLLIDLHKQGQEGHHVRLCVDPEGAALCDCQWSTYKPHEKPCRHRRAIPVLLAQLEEVERAVWERDAAIAEWERLEEQGDRLMGELDAIGRDLANVCGDEPPF
jgi:hypothetical protein